jgi:hypothetical protein
MPSAEGAGQAIDGRLDKTGFSQGFLASKVGENKQFAGSEGPDVVDLGEIRMQSAA